MSTTCSTKGCGRSAAIGPHCVTCGLEHAHRRSDAAAAKVAPGRCTPDRASVTFTPARARRTGAQVATRPTRSPAVRTRAPHPPVHFRPARRRTATTSRTDGLVLRLLRRLFSRSARSTSSSNRDYSTLVVVALLGVLLVSQGRQDTIPDDPAAAAPPATAEATAPAPAPEVVAASGQMQEVLRIAQAEVGYEEGPNNRNKYGAAYGVDNTLWCMQFVWWVFWETGAGHLIHPKTAFTPTAADWHRDRGQWHSTPQVGDLVFFNWPKDRVDRIQHVEIVIEVRPDSIITIGGNTGSGPAGSQDDGDGVWRRERPLDGSVVGFGRPAYAGRRPPARLRGSLTPSPNRRTSMDFLLQPMTWQHAVPFLVLWLLTVAVMWRRYIRWSAERSRRLGISRHEEQPLLEAQQHLTPVDREWLAQQGWEDPSHDFKTISRRQRRSRRQ
jgi:hypothetical protein